MEVNGWMCEYYKLSSGDCIDHESHFGKQQMVQGELGR